MCAYVNQSVECNVAVTNQHVLYLANEGIGRGVMKDMSNVMYRMCAYVDQSF